jgi:hypothetical protein
LGSIPFIAEEVGVAGGTTFPFLSLRVFVGSLTFVALTDRDIFGAIGADLILVDLGLGGSRGFGFPK